MEKIKIDTTQNVEIEYKVASVADRILAFLLDALILFAFGFSTLTTISSISISNRSFYTAIMVFIILIILIFYDLICEISFNGQSIGKKALKIKVVKLNGTKPTIGNYFLRWILRFVEVYFMGGAIALITVLINGKGQRIGDIAAGTTVVKIKDLVSLEDTIYQNVEEGYVVVYPEAEKLSEKDISILNDLILSNKESNTSKELVLGYEKAKRVLEIKLKVTANKPPLDFFHTLIKDYNHLNGKV